MKSSQTIRKATLYFFVDICFNQDFDNKYSLKIGAIDWRMREKFQIQKLSDEKVCADRLINKLLSLIARDKVLSQKSLAEFKK